MKKFNDEFKANAVRLVREEGLKIGDAASDLGIGVSTLKMWLRKHNRGQLIKTSKQINEEEEIKRLKKENRILRQEREILKKAMGIFSSMSQANTEL
jgi:transposase